MKGTLTSFIFGSLLAQFLLLFHGAALAYGSGSAVLVVSTTIFPEPPSAVVQILDSNKEIISTYELPPSEALEQAQIISMTEEAKGDVRKIKIISVTFN